MSESWLPVVGYEGLYEVSDQGKVASLPTFYKRRIILKSWRQKGYEYVALVKDNKKKNKRVHIVVMEAFTDYRSDGTNKEKTIDHIDGNKANNKLENLEVVTMSENIKRAWKNGLCKRWKE